MTERSQRGWRWALVLCACALPTAGHAESAAPWDAGLSCAQSRDCPCGYYCLSGECRYRADPSGLSCAGDLDCGSRCSTARCVNNVCVVPDAGPATDLGGEASVDTGPAPTDTGLDVSLPTDRGTVFVDAGGVDVPTATDLGALPDVPPASADAGPPTDTGTSPPPPEDDGGCSVRGGRGGRGGALWGGLVALAALGMRRRRRNAGNGQAG